MNEAIRNLKFRLRGTWIHHAVWAFKNPPPKAQDPNDGKQIIVNIRNANYDRQTVEVMFRVLRQNSNCIDAGAHVGSILRHMIDISPWGRHYAFEPLPHLSQKLSEKFPQAIIHQVALSDKSGESEFLFVENDPGYSGLRRRIYDRPDPQITIIRVCVATLDEMIPPDERIAFIKLDIEGGEFHAINGGIETIRRGKPVIVFEGGNWSTGQYGVNADDVYLFTTEVLGYELSTMERWLKRKAAYTRGEFNRNWQDGSEYYFIATPKIKTSHS
jgi:FkbM family methyltransferase